MVMPVHAKFSLATQRPALLGITVALNQSRLVLSGAVAVLR